MKSLYQFIVESQSHKTSDPSLQKVYDLLTSPEIQKQINTLQARWEDEYKYEDEEEYIEVIINLLKKKGISQKMFNGRKVLPKDYKCDEDELQLVVVGDEKVLGIDFANPKHPFLMVSEDDPKIARLLGNTSEDNKPLTPEVPDQYNTEIGKKVDLGNGKKCRIGDIVIKYDSFEGGYISIGQIVHVDDDTEHYIIRLANDDISTVQGWNDAVRERDTFMMQITHKKLSNEGYQPYDAKVLSELQDKLRKSRKEYPFRY